MRVSAHHRPVLQQAVWAAGRGERQRRRARLPQRRGAGHGHQPVIRSVAVQCRRVAAQWAAWAQDKHTPLLNRAIAGVYAPGSTFKMAVAMAGLESGAWRRAISIARASSTLAMRGSIVGARRDTARSYARRDQEQLRRVFLRTAGASGSTHRGNVTSLRVRGPPEIDLPGARPGFIPTREWRSRRGPSLEPRRHGRRRHRPGLHPGHAAATGHLRRAVPPAARSNRT